MHSTGRNTNGPQLGLPHSTSHSQMAVPAYISPNHFNTFSSSDGGNPFRNVSPALLQSEPLLQQQMQSQLHISLQTQPLIHLPPQLSRYPQVMPQPIQTSSAQQRSSIDSLDKTSNVMASCIQCGKQFYISGMVCSPCMLCSECEHILLTENPKNMAQLKLEKMQRLKLLRHVLERIDILRKSLNDQIKRFGQVLDGSVIQQLTQLEKIFHAQLAIYKKRNKQDCTTKVSETTKISDVTNMEESVNAQKHETQTSGEVHENDMRLIGDLPPPPPRSSTSSSLLHSSTTTSLNNPISLSTTSARKCNNAEQNMPSSTPYNGSSTLVSCASASKTPSLAITNYLSHLLPGELNNNVETVLLRDNNDTGSINIPNSPRLSNLPSSVCVNQAIDNHKDVYTPCFSSTLDTIQKPNSNREQGNSNDIFLGFDDDAFRVFVDNSTSKMASKSPCFSSLREIENQNDTQGSKENDTNTDNDAESSRKRKLSFLEPSATNGAGNTQLIISKEALKEIRNKVRAYSQKTLRNEKT